MDDAQKVTDLDVRLRPDEVLRMMGCPPEARHRPEFLRRVDELLEQACPLVQPRGAYIVCDVARMTDTELELHGHPSFHGPIAGFLKPSRRVAVWVSTIGDELERLASAMMARGDVSTGFVLDAIGSAAADLASDALADHILWNEARPDEAITPPFCPGYCGLALEEQQTLFAIIDASRIGVRLNEAMMMQPVKSVSGLSGIGDRQVVGEHGVPCQWCDLTTCRMRRS